MEASFANAASREIGIRVALGAAPSRVVRTALLEGLRLAVLGVALLLVAVTALASYLPAREL